MRLPTAPLALLLPACVDAELVSLGVAGEERAYWLHVPEALPPDAPVIFAFHGGGSPARHPGRSMPRFTGLSDLADERGFVAVYPEARDANWNDGRGMTDARDLAYFDAVLAEVLATTGADPARVFTTGISNGGFFSDHLACERADVLAGAAVIAATEAEGLPCAPARTIPMLFVPGTDDPLVPFDGGEVANGRGACRSVADTVADWRDRNGCAGTPHTTRWPDAVDDGTTITEVRACADGPAEVRLLTVEGGGHTWPGGRQYLPRAIVGRVSEELDASAALVDWFLDRPAPAE